MESIARRRVLHSLASAVLLGAAGCAGTYMAQPAQPKNHGGRITQATVVWAEPSAMPIRISKGAAAYGYTPPKPVIDDTDRRQAQVRAAAVVAAYRKASARLLTEGLAKEGVAPGNETRIEVRPVEIAIDANNGAVHVAVQVSVRHADSPEAWRITPVTQNMVDGKYWNVLRKPGIGDEADVDLDKLVASFSDTVLREMRFAGWFR
jgi:hypothetical protein